MKKIILVLFIIPFFTFAADANMQASEAINHNNDLIQQIAQVAPMSINPYTAVFVTSACSKIGFHNDYVSTHPFYNNWFVLILFGVLFLFTLIVRPVMATNQLTGTLVKADNWLENKAGIIINALIILLPILTSETPVDNEIVYQAGFISISFKALLILIVSTYVLFVIMTMRLFIDFLIFLSPIPFVDSALQIFKIVFSISLVIISVISPLTSVIITLIMFLISLIFYKKVKRLINRITYLVIYPILNSFREKEQILTDNESLSILVYAKQKTKVFKKGSILRLIKQNDKYFLIKKRFLLSKKEEEINVTDCTLSQFNMYTLLSNETSITLLLNRSYHNYINELSKTLNIEITGKTETDNQTKNGFISRVKNMFKKDDLAKLNQI